MGSLLAMVLNHWLHKKYGNYSESTMELILLWNLFMWPVQIGSKWLKWFKVTQNGSKWLKITQNDTKRLQMTKDNHMSHAFETFYTCFASLLGSLYNNDTYITDPMPPLSFSNPNEIPSTVEWKYYFFSKVYILYCKLTCWLGCVIATRDIIRDN